MRKEHTTAEQSLINRSTSIGFALLAMAALACVPIFSNGAFQTLKLVFQLSEEIAAGEEKVLQITAFPQAVRIKKTFVQVSGAIQAPTGKDLPARIKLQAELVNSAGRTTQRISLTVNINDDGSFSADKKIKKNIGAGDMMTVSLQPTGTVLAKGTKVSLCVDLVKKKASLQEIPPCVEEDTGNNEPEGETFAALQSDFLTPTCARAGCHVGATPSGDLDLTSGRSYANLVNVPSSQVAGLDRVLPNDPEMSYLIKKLRGDSDIVGERMPRGGPFLSGDELTRFVDWINDGAPDN